MRLKDFQRKALELKELLDPKRVERERKAAKKKAMAKGVALGAFLGGLAGVFLAPDKGENTRRKAKEELDKIKDGLQNNITEGKEKLEINLAEGKEKLTEIFEDKRELLSEKVKSLKEKVKPCCNPNIVEEEDLELNEEELVKDEKDEI